MYTFVLNISDKSKEPLDDFVHDDISDAESKDSKSDEDIEHNEKELVLKKEVSDSSSDDELEESQQSLYKRIKESIKKEKDVSPKDITPVPCHLECDEQR